MLAAGDQERAARIWIEFSRRQAIVIYTMPVSRDRRARGGNPWACSHRSRFRYWPALVQLGLTLLFAGWPVFRSSAAGIEHTTNGFVFIGSNSIVTVSDTNGSILSVSLASQTGSIVSSGEFGLWLLTNQDGSSLNAMAFDASSSSNTFNWTLAPSSNALVLTYSNTEITVEVTLSNRNNGVDLSAQVQPRQETVLEFNLPGRMRFAPSNLQSLICPLNSGDGVGAAFNSGFFQSQPQSDPAIWSVTEIGEAGYISLYGSSLVFLPVDDPPVPVSFTSAGTNWLGADLAAAWAGSNAIVNRPPAPASSFLPQAPTPMPSRLSPKPTAPMPSFGSTRPVSRTRRSAFHPASEGRPRFSWTDNRRARSRCKTRGLALPSG
jgi:hypothetical protein